MSGGSGYRGPHPPQAVPLPLIGEGINAAESGRSPRSGAALPNCGERSVAALPAGRSPSPVGWVGGVYPSAPLTARIAAFDGHRAFTRAARSAGLRFAVRSLSNALDREITLCEGEQVSCSPHPPLTRSPFPEKTVRSEELGVRICSARYLKTRFSYRALLLPIAYCLLPIAYCLLPIAFQQSSAPGPRSPVPCP